jgi:hypothetical protein
MQKMKKYFFTLILTLVILSEIYSMRIWEKNLKNHIRTLKLKTKHDEKNTRKPSNRKIEHVLELKKQQEEERRNRDERRRKYEKLTFGKKETRNE